MIKRKIFRRNSISGGLIISIIIALYLYSHLSVRLEVLAKTSTIEISQCSRLMCHSAEITKVVNQEKPPVTIVYADSHSSPQIHNQVNPTDHEVLFEKYSNEYKVSKEFLKRIAKCESGFNPEARNGGYGGMYQFASSTWASTRLRMGLSTDTSYRFNSEEAIKTAAFKISTDGPSAWPTCGK